MRVIGWWGWSSYVREGGGEDDGVVGMVLIWPFLSLKALGASVRIFDILDRHSEVMDGNLEPLGFEGGEILLTIGQLKLIISISY